MTRIKSFVRKDHPSIPLTDSVENAIERLLDLSLPEEERADCLVVLDAADQPAGLINAWLLLRALAIGAEKEDEPAVDALMKKRLRLPVSSAMAEEFPSAHPEEDLFEVLGRLGSDYFECLPVIEGGHYLGAVRTIDLFQAVSSDVVSVASGGLFTEKHDK
ncbi:MAG: CBS domain-containing protein [Opitutales bacterium]